MKEFYTIMQGDNFMNTNMFGENNENIIECIRFSTLESVQEYFEGLRKDKGFRIVKVKCTVEEL